jgi:hypothetical protein
VTLDAFRSRSVADPVIGVTTETKRIGEIMSGRRFRSVADLIARLRSELGREGNRRSRGSPLDRDDGRRCAAPPGLRR